MSEARKGVLAVVLACLIWGFGPAYYKHLSVVAAPEMLAHRTLWTLLMFGGAPIFFRMPKVSNIFLFAHLFHIRSIPSTLMNCLPTWLQKQKRPLYLFPSLQERMR